MEINWIEYISALFADTTTLANPLPGQAVYEGHALWKGLLGTVIIMGLIGCTMVLSVGGRIGGRMRGRRSIYTKEGK